MKKKTFNWLLATTGGAILLFYFVVYGLMGRTMPREREEEQVIKSIKEANIKSIKEAEKYYEKLTGPQMTSKQAIARMVEERGLSGKDTSFAKTVEYHVYNGSKKVIKQLVDNLRFEVEVTLPRVKVAPSEENNYTVSIEKIISADKSESTVQENWRNEETGETVVYKIHRRGKSYGILENKHGVLKHISPILHDELFRVATETNDPNLTYLVMELIGSNDCLRQKPDTDIDYDRGGNSYYDLPWYNQSLVNRDILAYLTIYAKYKEFPIIRDTIVTHLVNYPGEWLMSMASMRRKVLPLVDEQGPNAGYELYLKLTRQQVQLPEKI